MVSISIRKERYSYEVIKASREFVINVPDRKILWVTDYCGVTSGRDIDKFQETGLTKTMGTVVKAPLVNESPLNLECRVTQIIPLGSHDLFLAEVVQVHAREEDPVTHQPLNLEQQEIIAYGAGRYYQLGKELGTYGYSRKTPRE
jgi:flavin reductase (DIM6/NTAB) family NADH-FMN oxidoreductase RutF